ncbi:HAMP domain-containing protein [Paludisphaera soli]|uniref:HAMP domain-containing protein n=1 Tax=Paludisphaera soli TaxID=2712865 RepID=UPI0013EC6152|nr:HAMP domain-containing protein [Paludisphaera soli]
MPKNPSPRSPTEVGSGAASPSEPQGRAGAAALPSNGQYDGKRLLAALKSLKKGDFSVRLIADDSVIGASIAEAFNDVAELMEGSTGEIARIAEAVGKEGRISQRAAAGPAGGGWAARIDSMNGLIGDLVRPVEEVSRVIGAVAKGDLSQRIPLEHDGSPLRGEFLRIGQTVNTMVDQLGSFASEVTRVAREVGTEGKLGGQADVKGVAGTWKDLTDSVNSMAGNLTAQVRNIAQVTTAVANGDLSKKITVDVRGEILELKDTINTMVDQLGSFASEVTRVAREVGSEGRLGGQAQVRGVAGVWKDLTDSVNGMAGNLTGQVRNIAEVTTAVANGDLSKKITVDVRGEILQLKDTINTMVDQLNSFASEVTRVAREVGTEGKLGGQAQVQGVGGVWKDLTDNVNGMAGNLTAQVRNIAEVTTAVANGDLSKKITVPVKGEILELKDTINTMVDQLNSFASEVTRVAKEVGTEGKLGGQAKVEGVAGTWKDLTDNVNSMASNLTAQVRNIAEVSTAIANGDLSKKITVDVKGEISQLKDTINTTVDQLNSFASEVTRVAREVGTEGQLGGQAQVQGVAGVWKDLTDSVNSMAGNLTAQVRNIAEVTTAVANGDLTKKVTVDVRGEILELKNTINAMVDQLNSFASEVTRVAREVGSEGRLGGQAQVRGVAGVWKDLTDNVNSMAGNLTDQVRNIAEVTTSVANGDLSKKITVDVKGEILQLKNTINAMVDQLNSFASEVTRVAREVGTEGQLGGQAQVRGVAGVWKDLTDSVNGMAGNLTSQVRGIAKVVTAVANGDLKRKLIVEAKGEVAALSDTINEMIDTLATFADQVTSVAREVGVEGQLGGQAKVPGAAGTWKGLTENVNQLAANLTTQVRAIAEVATAVTKGDLTRSITVEAQGEVAALKDNINEMIRNLKDTTQKNTEQDWLKTNLAKFTRMLQGQRDLMAVTKLVLSELAPVVQAQHGVFYMMDGADGESPTLKLTSTYAYRERRGLRTEFRVGEGLVGQCAYERERILVTDVPGDYVRIGSGLGEAPPLSIVVLPVIFEGQVKAVVELASFRRFTEIHLNLLDQLTETIAIVLNTIAANMRTEALLKQSQSLAQELTSQQEELRETNTRLERQAASLQESEDLLRRQQDELKRANEELETKAGQLSTQKSQVEGKNREIELAKQELEEKAEQLALTSKYKSEFLANMSHELRTPLNSLLILAEMLSDNAEGNLTSKQREFAQTIHGSGSDLLSLINDILDMAKIESGTMAVDVADVPFADLRDYVERTFRPVAETRGVELAIELADGLPGSIATDAKRLQQVLRNLLSNAFKFTESGRVGLGVALAAGGWSSGHPALGRAGAAVAFAVGDTGIGIASDKLKIIFEPFQQADTGTSRKYGGTGLGLSISREIAHLLGGEIRVQSTPGQGSVFTLFLPLGHAPAGRRDAAWPGGSASNPPPTAPSWNGREATYVASPRPAALADHRDAIEDGDRVLLIVEHEPRFAGILVDKAHEMGFKAVATSFGEAALELARELRPAAVTLDLRLPDMDGWVVLDRLKRDPGTRHIPVHIISVDDSWQRGMRLGAFAFLKKPVSRRSLDEALAGLKGFVERGIRELLVVEDNELERGGIVAAVGDGDVNVTAVGTALEALEALQARRFDCLILDLGLPDLGGLELLERIKREISTPGLRVVVHTARDLTSQEQARLDVLAEATIVKDVRSLEHLVDKTALFLHRVEAELRPETRSMLHQGQLADPELAGRKVLIVDDDLRNVFALTSKLERWELLVLRAENGLQALEQLDRTPDVDLVLMDIMMPEMDGYETMRAIRGREAFRDLPIVALTAKAMKEDRQKCIEAGASDYLSKPVGGEQLLSTLRVWLRRAADRPGELGGAGSRGLG